MPNDYFQFQQFRIEQDQCAMKVSTDACLLGGATDLAGAMRLLDIGTGTGLLALMAAQRHPTVEIEAVEIDEAAAAQAAANVAASPWAGRVRVWPLSLAELAARRAGPGADQQFSHIICNPPFFRQSLLSAGVGRRLARHATAASLTLEEIADFAARFLTENGRLTLLLPPAELRQFQAVGAGRELALQADLRVRHRPGGPVKRHIAAFGRGLATGEGVGMQELAIEDEAGGYSAAFRALLGGFYLAL
ncbi:tRNA1(Val) (adenine(37)-N6)-methyltransferase [uncultured Hymenobacter sp.]|uniref:tRNA1(Val) (adenine(37)-N6)-methyltransferase n=1 Tax=uncultured Hymenobacter sp. TaxID=170016 RepID=UPI0035C99C55